MVHKLKSLCRWKLYFYQIQKQMSVFAQIMMIFLSAFKKKIFQTKNSTCNTCVVRSNNSHKYTKTFELVYYTYNGLTLYNRQTSIVKHGKIKCL